MMMDWVSPPAGMRPLSLLRPSAGLPCTAGHGRSDGGSPRLWPHRMMKASLAHPSTPPVITLAGSRRGERVVAELAQDVTCPADDLAGLGQGGALAVFHRRVVAVIGGAGASVGLAGLVYAPAQHRRSLP